MKKFFTFRRKVYQVTFVLLFFGLLVGFGVSLYTSGNNLMLPHPAAADDLWNIQMALKPSVDGETFSAEITNTGGQCIGGEVIFDYEFGGNNPPVDTQQVVGEDVYIAPSIPIGCNPCGSTVGARITAVCKKDGSELRSRTVNFIRKQVVVNDDVTIASEDGQAKLTSFKNNSITETLYVIVMPVTAIPGLPSAGVTFVTEAYAFRSSLLASESSAKNMNLVINYPLNFPAGTDPLTTQVYEWDSSSKVWEPPQDQSNFVNERISKSTRNFTTYVLGTGPLWYDNFRDGDLPGLDVGSLDNIIPSTSEGKILLQNPAMSGIAMSKPYTPSIPLKGWALVTYTAAITPGSSMTVSVLSADGTVLKAGVDRGDSLADINVETYPSLKLKVEMSTSSTSPELFGWGLLAEPQNNNLYLPSIIKNK